MKTKTIKITVQIHASQKYCNDGGCSYLDGDGALYCTLFQKGLSFENGNSKNRIEKCLRCKEEWYYDPNQD